MNRYPARTVRRIPSLGRRWYLDLAAGGLVAVIVAACAASQPTPTTGTLTPSLSQPPATSSPESSAVPPASSTASPIQAATAMPLVNGCSPDNPCVMTAGTWVTTGPFAFIPGLSVTVPAGWRSQEQDAGEFNLVPIDHPDDALLLWKDLAATTSDGTQKLVPGVPRTVDGLTAYLRRDPFLVVSLPTKATIAGGIQAITYVVGVSPSAKFTDHTCPVFPRCADLFTDPVHWGGGAFGFGVPTVLRLYLAPVGTGSDTHVFVVGLEAPSPAELARISPIATLIIASIRLPSFIGNG